MRGTPPGPGERFCTERDGVPRAEPLAPAETDSRLATLREPGVRAGPGVSSLPEMGLIDRLLRGRRAADDRDTRPLTAEEALVRWRYLLGRAPPEVLSEAHGRALEALGEMPRAEVLQRLRAGLSALEPGAVVPADPDVLLRAAARAERRTPGFLERALAADARGRQGLAALAATVVGSRVLAPYLRGFQPGMDSEALVDRRAPEVDVDAPAGPDGSGGHGGHGDHDDLDAED